MGSTRDEEMRDDAMAMTTIRRRGQVTIPSSVAKAAHLREGDPVEVEIVPEGILLRPRKVIDATQAWFWEPAWQAGEREASADIAAGRVKTFDNDQDFLESLA
jgi:antitoxin PrlF